MKARLAMILAVLAVLAAAAGGTAQGASGVSHTCNKSGNFAGVTSLGIGFRGNVAGHAQMNEDFDFQCGHGGTVEWKLQVRVSGVWTTESNLHGVPLDFQARNTRGKGQWVYYQTASSNLAACAPGHSDYRVVVTDSSPGGGVHVIEHDFAASCP